MIQLLTPIPSFKILWRCLAVNSVDSTLTCHVATSWFIIIFLNEFIVTSRTAALQNGVSKKKIIILFVLFLISWSSLSFCSFYEISKLRIVRMNKKYPRYDLKIWLILRIRKSKGFEDKKIWQIGLKNGLMSFTVDYIGLKLQKCSTHNH